MVAVLLATGYRFPAASGKFGNGGSASGFFLYLLGLLQLTSRVERASRRSIFKGFAATREPVGEVVD